MLLQEFLHISGNKQGEFPTEIPITFSNLVASSGDYLVKLEDNALHLSRNLGEDFTESVSIDGIGTINFIHLFEDGSLFLCDPVKAYYSKDWGILHESTVLDIHGEPYVPAEQDNFSRYKITSLPQIVDGVELLCWGAYAHTLPQKNIWYTSDKGVTVKSCFEFGVSVPNNRTTPISTRHIHNVDFNPNDETFWAQTGDEPTERDSHWIQGKYDVLEDEWVWDVIGSGDNYKTSNMIFYNDYMYYAWDITGGGVARVRYDEAHLPEKHEVVFNTPNDCIGIYMGERGDLVAFQTRFWGAEQARVMYYSPNLVDFHRIVGDVPDYLEDYETLYYKIWRVNNGGKLLAGVYLNTVMPLGEWDGLPSVWVDDIIKNAGFPNAFKPLD